MKIKQFIFLTPFIINAMEPESQLLLTPKEKYPYGVYLQNTIAFNLFERLIKGNETLESIKQNELDFSMQSHSISEFVVCFCCVMRKKTITYNLNNSQGEALFEKWPQLFEGLETLIPLHKKYSLEKIEKLNGGFILCKNKDDAQFLINTFPLYISGQIEDRKIIQKYKEKAYTKNNNDNAYIAYKY